MCVRRVQGGVHSGSGEVVEGEDALGGALQCFNYIHQIMLKLISSSFKLRYDSSGSLNSETKRATNVASVQKAQWDLPVTLKNANFVIVNIISI